MNSLREPRVPMQLRVEIHGTDWEGNAYREPTFTANISRTGTRLNRVASLRHVGEKIELRRGKEKAPYSVIWIGPAGSQMDGQVGMRLLDPVKNIWGVPLPPPVLVASDEEWAELSAGLPGLTPINETEEPVPAPASATPAATLDAEEVADSEESVATLNLSQGTVTEEPVEEPVAIPATQESRSLEEAFTRLQAQETVTPEPSAPPAIEPAETVGAAATDEAPPVFVHDDAAPAELPVPSVQPDTVTYGPQFLPEPSTPAAKPFYTRPVVYLGLGAALLILLVFSWTRTRTVPTQPETTTPVSASAAEPAPIASGPAVPPTAPVQQTQPAASQPAPTQSSQIEQIPQSPASPKAQTAVPAATGSFAVQVGAYESAETAQALAKSLGSRYGTEGVVDAVRTGGKTLHRVRLLAGSQADAKALAARVRRERAFDAIVVRVE